MNFYIATIIKDTGPIISSWVDMNIKNTNPNKIYIMQDHGSKDQSIYLKDYIDSGKVVMVEYPHEEISRYFRDIRFTTERQLMCWNILYHKYVPDNSFVAFIDDDEVISPNGNLQDILYEYRNEPAILMKERLFCAGKNVLPVTSYTQCAKATLNNLDLKRNLSGVLNTKFKIIYNKSVYKDKNIIHVHNSILDDNNKFRSLINNSFKGDIDFKTGLFKDDVLDNPQKTPIVLNHYFSTSFVDWVNRKHIRKECEKYLKCLTDNHSMSIIDKFFEINPQLTRDEVFLELVNYINR